MTNITMDEPPRRCSRSPCRLGSSIAWV